MTSAMNYLKESLGEGAVDPLLLARVEQEFAELASRLDKMEELLITLVRTGWPWDEDGEPNSIHDVCLEGYTRAMLEARDLLGLGRLSALTRTEPRT